MSETPQRVGVLERGLLIGGKSVSASSSKLADDVSPWGGEIYARVPPRLRQGCAAGDGVAPARPIAVLAR